MLPYNLTIEDILPHRQGMLLIGEVVQADEEKAVTRSTVSVHWPLTDALGAQSLVLVELAAQTAGIHNGLRRHRIKGLDSDHKGWIVGIKSARFHVPRLPLGTEVEVASQNRFAFEGFREIEVVASVQGRRVADITMQVVEAAAEQGN